MRFGKAIRLCLDALLPPLDARSVPSKKRLDNANYDIPTNALSAVGFLEKACPSREDVAAELRLTALPAYSAPRPRERGAVTSVDGRPAGRRLYGPSFGLPAAGPVGYSRRA